MSQHPPIAEASAAARRFVAIAAASCARVYIAGPMSGLPELNYPAFHAAALTLRTGGLFVENPAENEAPEPSPTWADWMRLGLTQMLTCSHVLLLPGWQKSRGAIIEARTALDLGMIVFDGETGAPVQSVHNIAPHPQPQAAKDTDAKLLKIAADANEALRQAWGAVITALHQCDEQLFADPTQTAVEAAVSSVWRTNAARKRAEAASA